MLKADKEEDKSQNDDTNESEKQENTIHHQKEIEKIIEWSENVLFPLLEQDSDETDVDLVIKLLNDILFVADNMIIIRAVNSMFYFKLGHFILKLLNTSKLN